MADDARALEANRQEYCANKRGSYPINRAERDSVMSASEKEIGESPRYVVPGVTHSPLVGTVHRRTLYSAHG